VTGLETSTTQTGKTHANRQTVISKLC